MVMFTHDVTKCKKDQRCHWQSRAKKTLLVNKDFRIYYYYSVLHKTKDREVDFDVETAIKVCRSAGYYQHALYLAEQHNQHDWYLKIQLEDIQDYQKALDYIGRLDFDEVCHSTEVPLLPSANEVSER